MSTIAAAAGIADRIDYLIRQHVIPYGIKAVRVLSRNQRTWNPRDPRCANRAAHVQHDPPIRSRGALTAAAVTTRHLASRDAVTNDSEKAAWWRAERPLPLLKQSDAAVATSREGHSCKGVQGPLFCWDLSLS